MTIMPEDPIKPRIREAKILRFLLGGTVSEAAGTFSEHGVQFHKRMKVEGVTAGQVAGRGAIVFVDDAGGYQMLRLSVSRWRSSCPTRSRFGMLSLRSTIS
jgi:hypothetical protein